MPPHVARAFQTFDADRSGALTARELIPALRDLGMVATSGEAIAMLQKYDSDGSGSLSLLEFAKLVESIEAFQAAKRDM